MLLYVNRIRSNSISNIKIFFCGLLVILLISSCVSNRRAVYTQVRPTEGDTTRSFIPYDRYDDFIKPGDELYIRVSSFDEESNFFTQERDQYYMGMSDITLVSYTVRENGFLNLPYAAEVMLEGLTLVAASAKLEEVLSGYLNQPSVFVKFVNKNITVLGEVARPGRYTFSEKNINIFQALGMAGDITYYGNRKRVMIIREENEIISRNYIDLTKSSLYGSYYYFLKPNDIVYVQPLQRRRWGFRDFPFDLVLASATTFVLILNYIFLVSHQ